jgi:hypothetical protein
MHCISEIIQAIIFRSIFTLDQLMSPEKREIFTVSSHLVLRSGFHKDRVTDSTDLGNLDAITLITFF